MSNKIVSSSAARIAAICLSASAFSGSALAGNITDRFDGTYKGSVYVNAALSEQNCAPLSLEHVEIENGSLWGYSEDGRKIARAIVTEDGFFTGQFEIGDGGVSKFEGLVDDEGRFSGGVISNGCAWLAYMSPERIDGVA